MEVVVTDIEREFGGRQIQAEMMRLLRGFCGEMNKRFWGEALGRRMAGYRHRPEGFARSILGSQWWSKQAEVARAVVDHPRVAVKSANGVGKTYLAADLALWFLFTHKESIVITTAPTDRQVRHVLWQEIRRRFRGARIALPGTLLEQRIQITDGWYAMGFSAVEDVRFQGFHAANLLILFDEASGIPDEIWDASEGIAVSGNNRMLAIGNPLQASGRFYTLFQDDQTWHTITISALEHPNITGEGPAIPGAVTEEAVEARIKEWCEPSVEVGGDFHTSTLPNSHTGTFEWRGQLYVPNDEFRPRVLGLFPESDSTALIPRGWIETAMQRTLPAEGYRRMAVDVARFGDDDTVIGFRVGPVVMKVDVIHGMDLMKIAGRVKALALELGAEAIAIDAVGIGGGVVDRLVEQNVAGIEPFSASNKAYAEKRFVNRRAEIYWSLRERFENGQIALNRDEVVCEELANIRYEHDSDGRIKIESKKAMKNRGMGSPDRADMLAMLFDGPIESTSWNPAEMPMSPAAKLRAEMEGW